jgi:hypothetical protein
MAFRLPRAAAVAAAVLLGFALGLVPALAPTPVAAATPSLTMVGAATYDVLPDEGRVAVTVRLTAANHLKNTATKRYFFRTAPLTVLPGTTSFKLSGGTGKPRVTVTRTTPTYRNLKLDFGFNLAAGKSTTLTLSFDLKDPGGAPDRPVRISSSIATFAAWAYATPETPGATVDVRFPAGYSVTIGRGPLEGPTPDGADHERWSSGAIAKPLDFVADVVADRPADYAETPLQVSLAKGPATVLLRAWPDDTAWRDRVSFLVEHALPILEREIGVAWPVDGSLAVSEALVRTTGGYAGLYAPQDRRIEIAYTASDGVILHELAHAWFNGRLVADRWTAEGFASYYAELAARELGIEADAPAPPPDPDAGSIPLNDWGPSGSESAAAETFAYAASLDLAEAVAKRAGPAPMRRVWSMAAAGIGAYQPVNAAEQAAGPDPSAGPGGDEAGAAAEPELAEGPPDWRGLLDLLEDTTGKDFGDLWRDVVARPADEAALDERIAARDAYRHSVTVAGEWRLPPAARAAMRAWQFETAEGILKAADAVAAERDTLVAAATAAGLQLPDRLRTAFEGDVGVDAAAAEAHAEQAVVDAIVQARASAPRQPGIGEELIIAIGLLGATPAADVDAAAAQLAAGDIELAYGSAVQAEAAWTGAPRVGRSRIVSTVLLVVALVLLAGLLRQQRQQRQQRRNRPGAAT